MKLADYYRTHGESEHVALVENALTDAWQSTNELVAASGKSDTYVRLVLPYLLEEDRALQREAPLKKPMYGQRTRNEWRRP